MDNSDNVFQKRDKEKSVQNVVLGIVNHFPVIT